MDWEQNKPPSIQQCSKQAPPLTSSAARTIALWGHDGADHHAGTAGVWLRFLRTGAVVLQDLHNTRALAQIFLCVALPSASYLIIVLFLIPQPVSYSLNVYMF